jgi:hypothetical protein
MKIQRRIIDLKTFAAVRLDLAIQVTPAVCGLAGYAPAEIGPMFGDGASVPVKLHCDDLAFPVRSCVFRHSSQLSVKGDTVLSLRLLLH